MSFDERDRFERFPPPSRPRQAKGGIKAATQRGRFGESWWARRWIQVLESFHIGSRLQRGRSYARKGQVLSIEVNKGIVKASVQGSREAPYQVTIKVNPLAKAEWERVAEQLSKQAIFAAKLLAGEMPNEIESAFAEAGLSLFPKQLDEIATACSCPDWSNPCKHVAAVYYLLGEAFDQDPFLIFRMRGMEREELIALLGDRPVDEPDIRREPEPLPAGPQEFWSSRALPSDLFGDLHVPDSAAALPRRLGNLPFWRGEVPFLKALEPSYQNASRKGEQIVLGEKSS
jgi:uncharacterized Zn finger protein